MISVIIPSYKNPKYLDLCLHSLLKNQKQENEIIVVIDGFADMYNDLRKLYRRVTWIPLEENVGLPMATNIGVINATSNKILIINEDNVAPRFWDIRLEKVWSINTVYAVQQIEPTPSIFQFLQMDFGTSPQTFRANDFEKYEIEIHSGETDDGYTLPIFMNKSWYMIVGGWDTSFQSPFVVDLDFFLKLQLLSMVNFRRTHDVAFYHFGSRSTKKRENNDYQWGAGEMTAVEQFKYKWGIEPRRLANNRVVDWNLRGL